MALKSPISQLVALLLCTFRIASPVVSISYPDRSRPHIALPCTLSHFYRILSDFPSPAVALLTVASPAFAQPHSVIRSSAFGHPRSLVRIKTRTVGGHSRPLVYYTMLRLSSTFNVAATFTVHARDSAPPYLTHLLTEFHTRRNSV